ncbi:hypothetical protein CU103_30600 [Phyllobacterium sophorae]|uniref:Uncharacterized protein n=1 Tax=Phyllobacterium sophorae TaxID=1520277 RepID=A0A2P7AN03_9HYPH|nr:hypothetical protein CU103_30600 [Phyllobacterium sophorae]
MELYARVRRAVFIDGLSKREAALLFGIDRRTVNKKPRFSVPPGYRRSKTVRRAKLDRSPTSSIGSRRKSANGRRSHLEADLRAAEQRARLSRDGTRKCLWSLFPTTCLRLLRPSRPSVHRDDGLGSWSTVAKALCGRITQRQNAHGTIERKLLYPWHPWSGHVVKVHEVIDKADGDFFRCSLTGLVSDRWLEIPSWMFDH